MKGRHRYMVIVRPAHRPLVEAVVLALDTRLLCPGRNWSACSAMDIPASTHAAALVSAEARKSRRARAQCLHACSCASAGRAAEHIRSVGV